MGGSFGFGNITPYAEFNFHTDPHAAKLVIQELSNKVILSPLNFTHKVIATSEIRKHMYDDNNEKRSSPIRNLFFRILTFYYKVYAANGFLEGPPIHDPLAVYSLLPFFNSFEQYGYTCAQKNIDIITEGVRMGESVIVEGGNTDKGVYIGEAIDNKSFGIVFYWLFKMRIYKQRIDREKKRKKSYNIREYDLIYNNICKNKNLIVFTYLNLKYLHLLLQQGQ